MVKKTMVALLLDSSSPGEIPSWDDSPDNRPANIERKNAENVATA